MPKAIKGRDVSTLATVSARFSPKTERGKRRNIKYVCQKIPNAMKYLTCESNRTAEVP